MADPKRPTREDLISFLPNQRTVKAFEKLFDYIPTDLDELAVLIEEIQIEAGIAATRATQALQSVDIREGAFFDTADHTAAAINTPTSVTFNNSVFSNGVEIDATYTNRINVDRSGIYKFEGLIQLNVT